MAVQQEAARASAPQGRGPEGRPGGLTMPQAIVISVVMPVVCVLAVVLSLRGMPTGEIFPLLGGAGAIGTVLVIALTPGGRSVVAAAARAALQAGR
ncbi:hypothetical protein [Streptomyces sp. H27-S2]|uniref:hypothetical protein n=1 Tax=Streptomyces antarcticus TaxID=2996458 RepID=UPI00226EC423|nr:hypothetical protein [Streptomyces sp. H27-S2]MCY0954100.1 hypothetical protein [Streptomyces sp. H27-S2]